MGMAPRGPSNGGRPYPAPHPPRRPPRGGSGEARAAAEHSVAGHVPVILPRTGLAGRLAHNPAVWDMLAADAARLDQAATRAHPHTAIGLSGTGSAGTRRERAAAWTYSPADAGWFDIVVEAPFAAAGRYWEWNKRVFARLAGWPVWWLLGATTATAASVAGAAAGAWWAAAVWAVAAVGAVVLAFRTQRRGFDADRAMVADLVAGVADRHPNGFTFRDVPVEAFTGVCVCPSCDTLALHWLAAADRVPEHTAADLPDKPVVWRECVAGCGFVWIEYA